MGNKENNISYNFAPNYWAYHTRGVVLPNKTIKLEVLPSRQAPLGELVWWCTEVIPVEECIQDKIISHHKVGVTSPIEIQQGALGHLFDFSQPQYVFINIYLLC